MHFFVASKCDNFANMCPMRVKKSQNCHFCLHVKHSQHIGKKFEFFVGFKNFPFSYGKKVTTKTTGKKVDFFPIKIQFGFDYMN